MDVLSCFGLTSNNIFDNIKYYINYSTYIPLEFIIETPYNSKLRKILKDNVPPKYLDQLIDELSISGGIDYSVLYKYILPSDIENIIEMLEQDNFYVLYNQDFETSNRELYNKLYDVLYSFMEPDEINHILNYIINLAYSIYKQNNNLIDFEDNLYDTLYNYFNIFTDEKQNLLILHIDDIIKVIKNNVK